MTKAFSIMIGFLLIMVFPKESKKTPSRDPLFAGLKGTKDIKTLPDDEKKQYRNMMAELLEDFIGE